MIIWNIKNFLEVFTYLYCLAKLFGKKFKLSIHAVVLLILILFLLTAISGYGFPKYLLPLVYIGMFLYGLLYYQASIRLTLVNCFLAAAIVTILQLFMLLPIYYVFVVRYELEQGDMYELLINVGCLCFAVLSSRLIKFKRLSDFFIKRNKLIVGVITLFFCGLGISTYQMKYQKNVSVEVYIQMIYFILILLFTIYEWQKTRVDVEKKRMQLEMNSLYYDAYDQLILLIRERQHDMKNHINAILSMIHTTDNYEELAAKQEEYCNYVIGQHEKTKLVLSVGNPLISGFLYSKIQEAEKKGIAVDYRIAMQKTASIVPEYELVEMLGILVDNAIEALSKEIEIVDNNNLKGIRLSIQETENNIEVMVANTSEHYEEDMTEHFFETGYSSKGTGRGIGLSKLKRMVHERQGDIVVSNELWEGRNYLTFVVGMSKEKRQKS